MPSPLIHVVISVAAGYLIISKPSTERKIIFTGILLQGLIDLDHLLLGYTHGVKIFHTLLVTWEIPFLAYITAPLIAPHHTETLKRYSLVALVLAFGHITLDLANGSSLQLLYPMVETSFAVTPISYGNLAYTEINSGTLVLGLWIISIMLARIVYHNLEGESQSWVKDQRAITRNPKRFHPRLSLPSISGWSG